MKKWYEELFDNYAVSYDKDSFTQGTTGEVDFIEKEIKHDTTFRILDIGCGTGRHSIELKKRGYRVTGVDLSEPQLRKARENAKSEGLQIDFIQKNACNLDFSQEFDLVIMICEGAFPLMETDVMNYQILESASRALTDRGRIIFTTLNGLYPLFHSVKDYINSYMKFGVTEETTFDLMTFREKFTFEVCDDSGNKKEIHCNERYYVPSEITWYLKCLEFRKIEIFGCRPGEFSRDNKLKTDDYEMLVVAEK